MNTEKPTWKNIEWVEDENITDKTWYAVSGDALDKLKEYAKNNHESGLKFLNDNQMPTGGKKE